MNPYSKIQSIYKRDPATKYATFLKGQFSTPELEYLKDNQWMFYEKIHGTNIRILITGDTPTDPQRTGHVIIDFKGRTENAKIPPFLLEKLKEIFYNENRIERIFQAFDFPAEGELEICLYGEGFGQKINKGSCYIPNGTDFILFDIKIGKWWLKQSDIDEIACKLELQRVPCIYIGTLLEAEERIKSGTLISTFGPFLMEGLVGRPITELKDRAGRRIITKIKHKDYLKIGGKKS